MAGGAQIDLVTAPNSFGDFLKFLRKRAHLTQRELAIAVGYSEAHISRLERNQRLPDLATLSALFVPALGLDREPDQAARLVELAVEARAGSLSNGADLTIEHTVRTEITESIEVPSNLPLELTSFLGRERELEEIHVLLRGGGRLVTLVGAGGCGKTRLALKAVERLLDRHPDGVWFVDLAPLSDPAQVPHLVAAVLELPLSPGIDITNALVAFLQRRKTLLIFDNCEHLVGSTAGLIEPLLRSCAGVQVLATSREPLNVSGEKVFQVPPLPCPAENDTAPDAIARFDSVRLFVERAGSAQPAFELTAENAPYVALVCRRLDGIPLAIELAAARVSLLRVREIESALHDRLRLLTSGRRTVPRHRTLRAMIDWSYDLLTEDEQRLFRRLSVFSGGWTLDAAHAVLGETAALPTIELLTRLADQSLINAVRHPGTEARYSLLETLREYALVELEAAKESDQARKLHFEYFQAFSRAAQLYGPEKHLWLDLLEIEYGNIRAAVTWGLEASRRNAIPAELVAGLVLSIVDFFWFRGYTVEARAWMDDLISHNMPASSLQALLLQKAGWFARGAGEFVRADALLLRALEMAREVGDLSRAAWALGDLGLSARDQGRVEQAAAYFSEGLLLARESGENRVIGVSLYNLAEGSDLAGDLDAAIALWGQGLAIFREEGDQTHIAWGLEGLAGAAYSAGDLAGALAFHLESLRIKVDVMDKLGIAHSLEGLAQIAAVDEEPERAAVLWGVAHRLRELLGTPPDPSRAAHYTSLMPGTRAQLGEDAFEQAWHKGEAMKLDEAIVLALRESSA